MNEQKEVPFTPAAYKRLTECPAELLKLQLYPGSGFGQECYAQLL